MSHARCVYVCVHLCASTLCVYTHIRVNTRLMCNQRAFATRRCMRSIPDQQRSRWFIHRCSPIYYRASNQMYFSLFAYEYAGKCTYYFNQLSRECVMLRAAGFITFVLLRISVLLKSSSRDIWFRRKLLRIRSIMRNIRIAAYCLDETNYPCIREERYRRTYRNVL